MFIPIDRGSTLPLTRQIASYLEEMIRRGHLGPGAPLPPTRTLARELRVNRKTVDGAYDELRARRLVSMRAGRGAVVRKTIPENPELDLPFRSARARTPFPAGAWCDASAAPRPEIDLAGPGPRLRTVSPSALRRFYRAAIDATGPVFGPPPPLGEGALRRAASGALARGGVLRDPTEIAIAADRAAAVAEVLAAFVPRGGRVLVDGLADPEIVAAIRRHGARTVRLGDRARWARQAGRAPRLLVVTTGASRLPQAAPGLDRRKALLDLARRCGVPVLEDVTGADRTDDTLPPLAALDDAGRVLPLADLADEVGGDVTAVALAGPSRLLARWRAAGRDAPDRLSQRVLANALDAPGRARAARAVRERRDLLRASVRRSLRRRLPELAGFEFAPGSDAVRLDLPEGVTGEALRRAAEARGVRVLSGRDCGGSAAEDTFVLLDLTRCEEGDLLEGVRELGEAFDQLEEDADSD
ncbi:MAG TPA: GntR family transcriptional regulator [bacterium]|nr:GntR family transcriptional regulator [bacterium]